MSRSVTRPTTRPARTVPGQPEEQDLPEYRRGRLLGHYARREQRNPGLYFSSVNLSFWGDEGDVLGSVLATAPPIRCSP